MTYALFTCVPLGDDLPTEYAADDDSHTWSELLPPPWLDYWPECQQCANEESPRRVKLVSPLFRREEALAK